MTGLQDWDHKLTPREETELVRDLEHWIAAKRLGKDDGWRPTPAQWVHILRKIWTK